MPRPLRPIEDGLVYHVINCGNNRQPVFFKAADYAAFLTAIADLKERKPFELYGYCLLNNHFHLLIRPTGAAIRRSNTTGLPYGSDAWVNRLAKKLDLDLTIRPRGRPPKKSE